MLGLHEIVWIIENMNINEEHNPAKLENSKTVDSIPTRARYEDKLLVPTVKHFL